MSRIDKIKEHFPVGARVELLQMDDYAAPPKGTQGTVSCVDDVGTVHIKWDNGSNLGAVLFAGDKIRLV